MLGMEDKLITAAYLLCIAGTLLCAAHSALNWNRGQETIEKEDIRWAAEEKKRDQDA